jgi:hypothetical protein
MSSSSPFCYANKSVGFAIVFNIVFSERKTKFEVNYITILAEPIGISYFAGSEFFDDMAFKSMS